MALADGSRDGGWSGSAILGGWIACVCCLLAVVVMGWVAEDGYISMRYASNLLAGEGLVFNRGERVQGFTHPLWLGLLSGAMVFLPGYAAAISLGFALTGVLLWALWRLCAGLGMGVAGLLAVLAVLFSSNSFLSYQTSGLENSLTHVLIVGMLLGLVRLSGSGRWALQPPVGGVGSGAGGAAFAVGLLGGLLALNRLDLALIAGVMGTGGLVLAVSRAARVRLVLGAAVGGGLVLLWLGFSAFYFGMPLPNTAAAKLGSMGAGESLAQSLIYVADFGNHEPVGLLVLTAGLAGAAGLLVLGVRALEGAKYAETMGAEVGARQRRLMAVIGLGATAYVGYLLLIGGDYMRGRLLTAPLLLAGIVWVWLLGRFLPWRGMLLAAGLMCLSALGVWLVQSYRAAPRSVSAGGLTDERLYYGEQHLFATSREMLLDRRPEAARYFHRYMQDTGERLAISHWNMGIIPWRTQESVIWVDRFGLTDSFVARCPAVAGSRVGHVERRIPRAYLRYRGCIDALPDWERYLGRDSAGLRQRVEAGMADPAWPSEAARRLAEELAVLQRGPLWAEGRWRLVIRHSLQTIRLGDQDVGTDVVGVPY